MEVIIFNTGKVINVVDYDNVVYPYVNPETGVLYRESEFIVVKD